jgi:low affinity Fe/Cu permease
MMSDIITNGSISADWVFGIIVSILGFLIWQNLRDVKEIIKKHENDINDLKLTKAESVDVEDVKQRNAETIREFDSAVAEVSKSLDVLTAKLTVLNKI